MRKARGQVWRMVWKEAAPKFSNWAWWSKFVCARRSSASPLQRKQNCCGWTSNRFRGFATNSNVDCRYPGNRLQVVVMTFSNLF